MAGREVSGEVREAELGYEFLRCRWMTEDDERPVWKRRVARAMAEEIERAAKHRHEARNERARRALRAQKETL